MKAKVLVRMILSVICRKSCQNIRKRDSVFRNRVEACNFSYFDSIISKLKESMDPYEVLGVNKEASLDDIRRAYRRLAKKYHPDVNSDKGAVEKIAIINAAYEQLADLDKRLVVDTYFCSTNIELEEDPVEAYKREYKRQKINESREKAGKKAERQAKVYTLIRTLCYPIGIFSILVIADFFLPVNAEIDYPVYGYQRTLHRKYSSTVLSYMKTSRNEFEVPSNVHLDYDYFAKEKKFVSLEFTPIFNTLRTIGVDHGQYVLVYPAPDSIYFPLFFPVPYIMLVLSAIFIWKKEYTLSRYSLSFMPVVTALIFFVIMVVKQV